MENNLLKFKAWDSERGEMYDCDDLHLQGCRLLLTGKGIQIIKLEEGFYNQPQLIPLQFTGLYDKNGKEIYMGDIVKTTWNKSGSYNKEIEFYKGAYGYINHKGQPYENFISYQQNINFTFSGLKGNIITQLEVIGNIYSHPDIILK